MISRTVLKEQIKEIFNKKYKEKFKKNPKTKRISIYEESAGFNEQTRLGAKQFSNQLGYFMEDIYNLSNKFNKLKLGEHAGNDGENNEEYFECKNRFDTMKQSQAYNEIKPKLEHAIKMNKGFKLLILIDKKDDRQIGLHMGEGLKKVKEIEGYDEKRHQWISGDNIYKYLFGDEDNTVKNYILELLNELR